MSDSNSPGSSQEQNDIQAAPTSFIGTLKRIGPGLILAGSIVGSGELIATTKTGAEAGFTLLWLIIIGCVIKVFAQIELGRYAITSSKTTLVALNEVPSPRITVPLGKRRARGNFILWFWLAMFLTGLGQLGGIVGGVGQAMAITWPITTEGRAYNQALDDKVKLQVIESQLGILEASDDVDTPEKVTKMATLTDDIAELQLRVAAFNELPDADKPVSQDDKLWAALITAITICVLISGRYGFIETFSMLLVGCFTAITIGNLFALQGYEEWSVKWIEIKHGLSFGLPQLSEEQIAEGKSPMTTALATFGIIGVGAAELVAYPYWCLEKGYGKWTGPRDDTDAWAARAKGWMRVMKFDAWGSMVVYTFATIAFYLLGAAILNRTGLNPEGSEMIRTLATMYEPVFGTFAQSIFLFGAIAVLYSTFFVANAAKTRLATDVLDALGIVKLDAVSRRKWIRIFSVLFPLACISVYILYPKPAVLILISGVMQALLLPMLGGAALYFRYQKCDERLKPSLLWDLLLWISFGGFLIVGLYLTYIKLAG